jgi:hypothetical protein
VADEMGARPAGSSRPDAEPTINEAGEQGFAIDGTDSFTVPGPGDGLPPENADEDAAARAAAMRRLLITLGAAVAVLAAVIVVGRSGGSGDRFAGTAQATEFSLPSPFGDGGTRRPSDTDSSDDATFTTYDVTSQTMTTDDDFGSGSYPSYPSYPVTSNSYDDSFSDDSGNFDVPYYTPSRTTPRTFPRYTPPVTRPRVVSPPAADDEDTADTEDTAPETDPTTTSSTSTTSTTSTTTTTTTTTPPAPASAWKAPTTPLGLVCGDDVRLWADHQSVLAAIGTARVWRSIDGGATWTEIAPGGVPTAYADDPIDPATAWVATPAGVFKIAAGVPTKIGDLAQVTSLSAVGTGASTTLAAVNAGQVQLWTAATGWTPTAALPTGTVAGAVLALAGDSFLVGTDGGIFRSDGEGPWIVPPQASAGVVGAPARTDATTLSWLLADHTGVLRSTDAGMTWTSKQAPGIASTAGSLAYVPALGLVTTGADTPLVSSLDGVAWAPLTDQPPYRPDGIARAGSGAGTAVWTSQCVAGGQPTAGEAVLRLADT